MRRALALAFVVTLAGFLTACPKSRASGSTAMAEASFWQWFGAHRHQVAAVAVAGADQPIARELATKLHAIDRDLAFELAAGKSDGEHELVISADGMKRLFPTVKRVVAGAPAIPGWKITAFRPRKSIDFAITTNDGTRVSGDAISFRALGARDGKIDIAVYVKEATSVTAPIKQAVYVVLEAALGEYDVEMRVGEIAIEPGTQAPPSARPLRELAKVVDETPR